MLVSSAGGDNALGRNGFTHRPSKSSSSSSSSIDVLMALVVVYDEGVTFRQREKKTRDVAFEPRHLRILCRRQHQQDVGL